MIETKISSRYARALLDYAKEQNAMDQVKDDAQHFLNLVKEYRELLNILRSPVVAKEIKLKLTDRVFREQFHEVTHRFIRLVIKKRRERLFLDIFSRFKEMYNEVNKISAAIVTTATKVDQQLLDKARTMVEKYTKTTVNMETRVDENLIGGFILRFSDKKLDASVAKQLKSIQKELVN